MKRFLSSAIMIGLLTLTPVLADTHIGYTNGESDRNHVFRNGSTEKQGMAIKLKKNKLLTLKGRTISSIEAVFGSKNTTNNTATVFIATSPDGQPLREKTVTINRAAQWQTITFDSPYVVTGEEEALYIGYTVEAQKTLFPLSADYSMDSKDCSFSYTDGQWKDMYGLGYGNANIRVIVDETLTFTDAMLKTVNTNGYYKQDQAYSYSAQLYNIGTVSVKSFNAVIKIGESDTQTISYTDVNIAQGSTFDIVLPDITATRTGEMPLSIEIKDINGGADADQSDNTSESSIFFYPAQMERSLLLESFTGQDCPNCPAGHRAIDKFLTSTDKQVIEVTHHAGYQPDMFSMQEDYEYTYFYGSTSTFAPAFMMNRTVVPQVSAVPVMNVGDSYLTTAADAVWNTQPYVSLKLESAYNPGTREVSVKAMILGHNDLPSEMNVLNVMLVQDGIIASQSNGGTEYTHNAVFRGALTDNAFGIRLPENFRQGSTAEWNKTFTLPESIYSSFWTDDLLAQKKWTKEHVSIATVPENMYIVAYVGAYTQNKVSGHNVYNCVRVKLGESYTQQGITAGITETGTAAERFNIRVDGQQINVEGDYDTYYIYNISGCLMPKGKRLSNGIYIVRIVDGGKTVTRKVAVK